MNTAASRPEPETPLAFASKVRSIAVRRGWRLAVLGEPLVNLLWRNLSRWTFSERFSQYRVFGSVVIGRGEMRLGVFYGHLGKLAEGDGFSAHKFRQFDLAPRIGFALLGVCRK